jgi:hypothetical protein
MKATPIQMAASVRFLVDKITTIPEKTPTITAKPITSKGRMRSLRDAVIFSPQ